MYSIIADTELKKYSYSLTKHAYSIVYQKGVRVMGRNKREQMEFQFYEIPQSESVRVLLGEDWERAHEQVETSQHFHNLMQIGICRKGSGMLTINGRKCQYTGGMISVIPANCTHHISPIADDLWEFIVISSAQMVRELYPNSEKIQEEKLAMLNRRAVLFGVEESAELAGIAGEILSEMREQQGYYRDVVRELVKIFLMRLLRRNEEISSESPLETFSNPQIQPALAFIHENYNRNVKAEELAKQCGLSEPYFRRVFREYVNMSPIDYLNFVRVREACKMMNRSDRPMDIIASECGYTSVSAFTRNFKKFLNITHLQIRVLFLYAAFSIFLAFP